MKITDLPLEVLTGDIVRLEPPSILFLAELHCLIRNLDKLHHEFLSWSRAQSSFDETRKKLIKSIDNFRLDSDEYKFFIFSKDNNDLVGCISIFIVDCKQSIFEIGYWLGSDAMGFGYAEDACKVIIRISEELLNAQRLEIKTATRNHKSRRVAEKCGFVLENIIQNNRVDNLSRPDGTCVYVRFS